MPTSYLVVGKDGIEYGPLDRDTIQRWYYEGRLDRNSKVYEPGEREFRLKEVFDLTVWNNPALIEQAAASSNAGVEFKPRTISELAGVEDRQPTPGMFAAGILLIVNGVIGLLVIGLNMIGQFSEFISPRGYIVPFIDLIVAVGLIRGNEKFRKWGLVRAMLGGVVILLVALRAGLTTAPDAAAFSEVSVSTVWVVIQLVFQFVFCVGIAALLWGDWPSKLRVGFGVAAVLVAWSGVFTTTAVLGFVAGLKENSAIARYSIPGGAFEDNRLGVSAKLPDGWTLLRKENTLAPVPDAAMIALHAKSGCFAALVVEPDAFGATSTSDYLTLVLQNRQTATPTLKEIDRYDVDFGGHQAKRLETSWTTDGQRFRGFSTACKAGHSYYLLVGWCLEGSLSKALSAYKSLEGVFEVGPRPATEPSEIAVEPDEDFYELEFFIQEHKISGDGEQTIITRGLHEGATVGFELSLAPKWTVGSLGSGLVNYTGISNYRSLGSESDSLVRALDQLFATTQSPKRMKDEVRFSAISLEGDPRDLKKGPVKLKLFFDSSAADRYAEFFTNIDLHMRRIYLAEKDPEYRAAIVKALQAR
jgi:hypothetical protein